MTVLPQTGWRRGRENSRGAGVGGTFLSQSLGRIHGRLGFTPMPVWYGIARRSYVRNVQRRSFGAAGEFIAVREPETAVFAGKRDRLAASCQNLPAQGVRGHEHLDYRLEERQVLSRTRPSGVEGIGHIRYTGLSL